MPTEPTPKASLLPPGVTRAFVLVTVLFFLWGIPNNLNDVLIKQFMKSFAITRLQAGFVQSAFYLGYFLLALPAGLLMKRRGYKAGFVTGLILFATGCFLFVPAARSGQYAYFLTCLFVIASGLSFLETAANPFIATLGPAETSEPRLNLSQAFNPIGSILGVVVGTRFIFSGVELTSVQVAAMQSAGTYATYLHRETLRVVTPYLVLGSIALLWAVLILTTKFPAFVREKEAAAEQAGSWRALLAHKHFLFALLAQFLYVGAQVGTWSYFISYAQDYTHVSERSAGYLLTGTLAAFGVGRFLSAAIMRRVSPGKLMALYAAINVLLLLVGIFHPGRAGLYAILASSFFMSVMFPTIFALGLRGLGPNTNLGGGFLVMTIIGGAVLTPIMGLLAERSMASAYQVPLYSYLVIAAFSLYMTRQTRRPILIPEVKQKQRPGKPSGLLL